MIRKFMLPWLIFLLFMPLLITANNNVNEDTTLGEIGDLAVKTFDELKNNGLFLVLLGVMIFITVFIIIKYIVHGLMKIGKATSIIISLLSLSAAGTTAILNLIGIGIKELLDTAFEISLFVFAISLGVYILIKVFPK